MNRFALYEERTSAMLTIGEFSRRSGLSARMLRHYDALSLLRPAHIGEENRYRYYDETQLSVLRQIETLKSYGFPLGEIPELLTLPREELAGRLHRRRLKAYDELNALRRSLHRMEDLLLEMEDTAMIANKYSVIVMTIPAQRVFGLRRTISVGETHALFQELYAQMEARGLKRAGAAQLLYLGNSFDYSQMEVEAQVQVAGDHPDVKDLPEQTCVATTHIGPYEELKGAYEAVGGWIGRQEEYEVSGPAIERYLKDEDAVSDPMELETGILFPVSRK